MRLGMTLQHRIFYQFAEIMNYCAMNNFVEIAQQMFSSSQNQMDIHWTKARALYNHSRVTSQRAGVQGNQIRAVWAKDIDLKTPHSTYASLLYYMFCFFNLLDVDV